MLSDYDTLSDCKKQIYIHLYLYPTTKVQTKIHFYYIVNVTLKWYAAKVIYHFHSHFNNSLLWTAENMISENRTELILKLRKSVYKFKTGIENCPDRKEPDNKNKKISNEIKLKGYCR